MEKHVLSAVKNTKNLDLNHSNMANESGHDLRKNNAENFYKTQAAPKARSPDRMLVFSDGGEKFI